MSIMSGHERYARNKNLTFFVAKAFKNLTTSAKSHPISVGISHKILQL